MDWKELLAKKVEEGSLERTEYVPEEENDRDDERKSQVLHVSIDRKGRKGKTATIVDGFTCSNDELLSIAASLKARLGTGGSARGGEILIQGDAVDKVKSILAGMGYKVK